MNRYLDRIVVLSMFLAIAGVAGFPSWAYILLPPPIYYPAQPIKVERAALRSGDEIVLQGVRCNSEDRPVLLTASALLTDGRGHSTTLGGSFTAAPPGCVDFESRAARVPMSVESGRYRVETFTIVQGRYGIKFVSWESEWFDVIKTEARLP
jgi:hypothetical protein